ncbi:polyphosphate kinase 2 [Pseudorhodobacter ferrugineus]|uniref:polyphosphate kinase 2 n=1 Tax=Pseudorhodobacter ferrugineus TaxID=77008 RepID=UPI0003B57097|nr:polyphosphate kinase 2 [Pseudorhodobacter ferrugineus]
MALPTNIKSVELNAARALQADAPVSAVKVETVAGPKPARRKPGPKAVDPETVRLTFEQGKFPYARKLARTTYEAEKAKLQAELLKVQLWAQETGQRFVILMEGRDAAGKGGTIKRFMEHLNPRYARVVALTKPGEKEKGQWFFQRYIEHLPTSGEIVFFDRSWYNRAGVERVMGFCSPAEYLEFMREAPELERMLVRSGIQLYKYWFSVTQEEQRARFESRETDPLKRWKLSPIDKASLDKWGNYTEAKEAMFFYTDTADAPWTVVKSNDKKRARLNCMRHFLTSIEYPAKDVDAIGVPDPLIIGKAGQVIRGNEALIAAAVPPELRKPKAD